MSVKLKPVSEQVIVITGATSGIGLATAREAAKRGAKLVLCSRDEADLGQIADELSSQGRSLAGRASLGRCPPLGAALAAYLTALLLRAPPRQRRAGAVGRRAADSGRGLARRGRHLAGGESQSQGPRLRLHPRIDPITHVEAARIGHQEERHTEPRVTVVATRMIPERASE